MGAGPADWRVPGHGGQVVERAVFPFLDAWNRGTPGAARRDSPARPEQRGRPILAPPISRPFATISSIPREEKAPTSNPKVGGSIPSGRASETSRELFGFLSSREGR